MAVGNIQTVHTHAENTQEMSEVKWYWCSDKEVTGCPLNQHPGTAAFHRPTITVMHGVHIRQRLKDRLLHEKSKMRWIINCSPCNFLSCKSYLRHLYIQVMYNKFKLDFFNVQPLFQVQTEFFSPDILWQTCILAYSLIIFSDVSDNPMHVVNLWEM